MLFYKKKKKMNKFYTCILKPLKLDLSIKAINDDTFIYFKTLVSN